MTEQEFIQEHRDKKPAEVALLLSKNKSLNKDYILNQINGLQKAKKKLPEFYKNTGIIYPTSLSIEQCSSDETAIFKSELLSGSSLVDLTGGFGVDTYYFSKCFDQITHVEPNNELHEIAKQNWSALEVNNITSINTTAEEFLENHSENYDIAYIDPSRRSQDKRVYRLEECTPNIIEITPAIFKIATKILVKTAPLLDIKQSIKDLNHVTTVFVVSVNNECKEVLYLLEKDIKKDPQIHCINIDKNSKSFIFDYELESGVKASYSEPLKYLYEPNASILKAGAFNYLTAHYELKKLAPNTHLYTSSKLVADFPGRVFKIETIQAYQPKAFKKLGIKKANVSCRNFKDSVEQVKKKMNLKDGGDYYIFACSKADNSSIIIVCLK
jgi:hypothetical protein